MFDFAVFATPAAWISLATLTLLEIVLGIDNIVFISIISSKLPKDRQGTARRLGLILALVGRLALLGAIAWLIGLEKQLFTVLDNEISIRDLILIAGGLFLMANSVTEIHGKLQGTEETNEVKVKVKMSNILIQIVLLDLVFSLDSILTAIGLVEELVIMGVAILIAIGVMLIFAKTVSEFVNNNPTIKMLALSFLLMIGMLLVVEAFDVHVPKGYIYFAMAFSLFVEILNLKLWNKNKPGKTKSTEAAGTA